MQVLVRDNNIDQALRVLKKKMQREGMFREMKQRQSYEKPSERKNREKAEAIRRARKLARKKAVREGLIADPKKKLLDAKKKASACGREWAAIVVAREREIAAPPRRFVAFDRVEARLRTHGGEPDS